MKTYQFILILVVLVALIAAAFYQQYTLSRGEFWASKPVSSVSSKSVPPVYITYSNLESQLSKNTIVKAIPEGSEFLLRFYNFNSGERQWEKSYTLSSTEVKEVSDISSVNAQVVLTLDSKYLRGLTNNNFCSMIQLANKNGELGFETSLSQVALAWKFKSLYSYRSCFGM